MSQVIDTKVVEMQFDNSKFEKNIEVSLNSLKNLTKSIDLAGKNRGSLDELANASEQVGLSFDNMNAKSQISLNLFDLLSSVGTKAFNKISDAVAGFAMNMANSLSGMQAMRDGFNEYELKMGSVQTILNGAKIIDPSTGENMTDVSQRLDVVNKKLEELNAYSDKTIYSFKDMTSNIGKFTNAGVNLDDSVAAIQGVANVAAVSGANASEASRAMYNFSQALSSGAVKLIDWKSLENANMATMDFKQNLLDTAVALGTVTKEGDKYISTTTDAQGKISDAFDATMGFNDSLSHQWMTTDVLTQTLKNYSTDVRDMTAAELDAYKAQLKSVGYTDKQIDGIVKLSSKAFEAATEVKTFSQMIDTLKESLGSGWAQSFEIIFGNFEEAKALWTGLNNAIDGILSPIGNARNAILKMWKTDGGRDAMIKSFSNLYHAVVNLISPIKDLWLALTPNTEHTGKALAFITKGIEKLTALIAKAAKVVGTVLATILKPIVFVGNIVGGIIVKIFGLLQKVGGKFIEIFSSIGKTINTFTDTLSKAFDKHITARLKSFQATLTNVFSNIKKRINESKSIKTLVKAFNDLRNIIHDLFGRVVAHASMYASNFAGYLGKIWGAVSPLISSAFMSAVKTLSSLLLPKLRKVVSWVADEFKRFGDYISGIDIKNSKLYKGFAALPEKIAELGNSKTLQSIFSSVKNFGSEAISFLSDKFRALKGSLDSITMPTGLSNVFETIKNFIKSVFGKDSINDNVGKTAESVGKIKDSFGKAEEMTNFQKFLESVTKAFEWFKTATDNAKDAIERFFRFIARNTPKALRSIHDFLAGEDGILRLDDVVDILYSVSDALSMVLTAFGVEKMGKAADGISEAFGDIATSVTNLLKRTSNKMRMEAVKDFAIAVGILAGSLFLLAQLPVDKLLYAGIVLVGLAKALTYFFDYISTGNMNLANTAGFLPIAALVLSIGAAMVGVAASLGILVGALAVFPRVIESYNNLGEKFRTGMDRVKEVLAEIFEYLDHTVSAKYGFRSAAALLGLVASLGMIRKTIIKFANEKTGAAMEQGLARIKEVLDLLGDFLSSVSLASFNFVNIGVNFNTLGIAAIIFALGSMMKKIAAPITELSKLNETEFKTAFDALTTILLGFGVFLGSVGALTSVAGIGLGQWLGLAATITLLANAISTVVKSLETIANLANTTGKGFGTAITVLTGIFVGLGALLFIIGKFRPEAAVGTLFGMSLAVSLLTACVVALVPLAATKPSALLGGVLAVGSLMIALGVALMLAGKAAYKVGVGDIIQLIAMSLSMVLLATVLRRLAKSTDPEGIVAAGLAISGAVMAMAGALKIISGIKMVNPLVLVGLGILAAAIWGVAFAIKAFKSSAGGMSEGAKQVSSGAAEMEGAVKESGEHLEAYAGEVIPNLVDKIFNELGPKIKEAISNFDLTSYLREKFEMIKASAKNWAQDFIDIGTNLMEGIATALEKPENIERIKGCIKELGHALLEAFKSFFGIASPSTVMAEQGGFILEGLVQGLMKYPEKLAEWVSGIGQFILDGISGFFTGALEKGQELVDNISTGIQNGKEFVKEKASEIGEAALDKVAQAKEWGQKALTAANSFGAKLRTSKSPIGRAAGTMITSATSTVSRVASTFHRYASNAASRFRSGIASGQGPARSAASALVSSAQSAFSGIYSSFLGFGYDAAQGFKNGINNMVSSIASAAAGLVRAAKNAAKNEQNSNSPSKDFMEYGTWAAQGYALGLVNNRSSRLIEENARKMVDTAMGVASDTSFGLGALSLDSNPAVSSLAYAMSQISDSLDANMGSDITIRPVVDLSDVNNSASAISALFGNKQIGASVDLMGSVQSDFNQLMANRASMFSTKSIDKLANRIDAMTDTMNSRSLNNYITVNGNEDPDAFADSLTRRFKLNARTM